MTLFNPYLVLLRLGLLYFILGHFNGCLWWGVWKRIKGHSTIWPTESLNAGFGPPTWLENEDFIKQYLTALYWGLSALSGPLESLCGGFFPDEIISLNYYYTLALRSGIGTIPWEKSDGNASLYSDIVFRDLLCSIYSR